MASQTPRQKKTVERVMHEFKHEELESGPGGKAGRVKSPRQAIAVALSEAGASNEQSPAENRHSRARSQAKEKRGKTAQAVKEGPAAAAAPTHAALMKKARAMGIPGRSRMSKAQLERAMRRH
jgi:hypothetical protein